ncbi:MAG TPA: sigma-70 family RNA polymerase sigma factor [Thermoanaerobaculia bacterium]|nr:sigma-70 family RNA polymerase sigma factor [Thermoanaerobaculia bacterium]
MDNLGPGDHNAMDTPEELFRRYHRPVVHFFERRGFSREESRDLAQETFFRVFKHIDGFRGESSVETWLFQVAGNLYKNTLRSQQTLKRDAQEVPLTTEEGMVELDRGSRDRGALASLLAEERAKMLRNAFKDLPPQMRQAVLLRVRDLKYREIAKLMDVSIETVKAHLYQARQQLRNRLSDYFTDDDES